MNEAISAEKVRILVVEDDVEVARLLTRYLEKIGYEVEHIRHGQQAIHRYRICLGLPPDPTTTIAPEPEVLAAENAKPFVAVVVDGLVPGKNGFQVAAAMRALPYGDKVGIVMVTGAYRNAQSRQEALQRAGVDAFYLKPFDVHELRECLSTLIKRALPAISPKAALPVGDADRAATVVANTQKTTAAARSKNVPPLTPEAEAALQGFEGPASFLRSAARQEEQRLLELQRQLAQIPLQSHVDAVQAVLAVARARVSGILRFLDGTEFLDIAFLRGVPVGASDAVREHLLGERLLRKGLLSPSQMQLLQERISKTGERVAEALLAMGLVAPQQALAEIEAQARERIRSVLRWQRGVVRFVPDMALVDRLAAGSFYLLEELFLGIVQSDVQQEAASFASGYRDQKLQRSIDFDDGLSILSKVSPSSMMPVVFLSQEPTPVEILRQFPQAGIELYAMWLLGLIRTPQDALHERPLPRILRPDEVKGEVVDTTAVAKVCHALLVARGRDAFSVLGLSRDADADSIQHALERVQYAFGAEAIGKMRLGPARTAGRDLANLVDDIVFVMQDEKRRQGYIQKLSDVEHVPSAALSALLQARGDAVAANTDSDPKHQQAAQAFWRGREALGHGQAGQARQYFTEAASLWPLNTEYQAFLALAMLEEKSEPRERALDILQSAASRDSKAMLPVYFLGLAAFRVADYPEALRYLREAEQRAPDDPDVQQALHLVLEKEQSVRNSLSRAA